MSIIDKIKAAVASGEPSAITKEDLADIIVPTTTGHFAMEVLLPGPYQDTNLQTSRYIGVGRSDKAVLNIDLPFVVRDEQYNVVNSGVHPAGTEITIAGYPGYNSNTKQCSLVLLIGSDDDNTDDFTNRIICGPDGYYIDLKEGVDYDYVGPAPMSAVKTSEEVITARNIQYVDVIGCEGVVDVMRTVLLCTQFGETFLELDGVQIMLNPVEGIDYV